METEKEIQLKPKIYHPYWIWNLETELNVLEKMCYISLCVKTSSTMAGKGLLKQLGTE